MTLNKGESLVHWESQSAIHGRRPCCGSGAVAPEHVVIGLEGLELIPARAGGIEQAEAGSLIVQQRVAGGAGVAADASIGRGMSIIEHHIGPDQGAQAQDTTAQRDHRARSEGGMLGSWQQRSGCRCPQPEPP